MPAVRTILTIHPVSALPGMRQAAPRSIARRGLNALVGMVACAVASVGVANAAGNERLYSQIEESIKAAAQTTPGRSISIGIVENGKLVAEKHLGSITIGQDVFPTSKTIYPIASITKVITGMMLLQLVDRGVVHLTDRADKYVPELSQIPNPYPWAPPVTLIQLATMTSGIDSGADFPPAPTGDSLPWDDDLPGAFAERAAATVRYLKYEFEPGTRRSYSSASYAILGLALSRAVGRTYDEYVESEIFKPLGMNDTSFSITESSSKRFAYGDKTVPHLPSWRKHTLLPAAGAFSTMEDMVRLMRFQLGMGPDSVLSRKALEDSFRLVVPSDGDLSYGDAIGFSAVRNPDSKLVSLGHGGRTWFFSGAYQFDRAAKSGIIVFTTHWNDEFKPLVREALKNLHPDSPGGTGLSPLERH